MNPEDDAFSLGKSDGYAAGINGDLVAPKPDPLLFELKPEGRVQYLRGAALGFEEGRRRREEVHVRAQADLERNRPDHER